MNVFEIIVNYKEAFAQGLKVTLQLCLIIWSSGLLFGTILGVAGARWKLAIGIPSRTISFFLSGIPILVFLFWLHYPLQAMLNVVIDPFYTSAATLSIINIFVISDVVRGVIRDFPEQYITAARVCGLPSLTIFWKIQLPLMLRQIIPELLTVQVYMLQSTLFASLISVEEIFRVAQRINAEIYKPVEIYSALGIFFIIICLPLNGLAIWLKKKYTRNISES